MRFIPFLILFYIWLIVGRADHAAFPILRWLTYLLIPMLLVAGAVYLLVRGKFKKTVIDIPVMLLMLLMAASAYLNHSPWKDFLYGVGVYLRYPLLFILFCNLPQATSESRRFLSAFVSLVVFLTLEALFDFFVFGRQGDVTFFTLGESWGTRNAGIFFAMMIALVAARTALTGLRASRIVLLVLIVAASIIASTRTELVLALPIILVVLAIRHRWLTYRGLTGITVVITILIFAMSSVDWNAMLLNVPVLSQVSPGYRLMYINEVLAHVSDVGNLFLGAGPRSMAPGTTGSYGVLYQYFLNHERSVVHLGSNQYVKGIAELGLAGMLVYWYMLYRVLKLAWRNWLVIRRGCFVPGWFKVINLSFFGVWMFYACFGLISNDLWRMDASSLMFWAFAAMIAIRHRDIRTHIHDEKDAAIVSAARPGTQALDEGEPCNS